MNHTIILQEPAE